jgi:preprotein translocase subunit SecA
MEYMREGIYLRSFAQKDPLTEYRAEGHAMFEELSAAIREEVVLTLFHAQIEPEDREQLVAAAADGGGPDGNLRYEHESLAGADAIAAAGGGMVAGPGAAVTAATPVGGGGAVITTEPQQQIVRSEEEKLGRNDPCWCGSGKKYKKCHGA